MDAAVDNLEPTVGVVIELSICAPLDTSICACLDARKAATSVLSLSLGWTWAVAIPSIWSCFLRHRLGKLLVPSLYSSTVQVQAMGTTLQSFHRGRRPPNKSYSWEAPRQAFFVAVGQREASCEKGWTLLSLADARIGKTIGLWLGEKGSHTWSCMDFAYCY